MLVNDPNTQSRSKRIHAFGAGLAQQEILCSALEDLADTLPRQLDTYAAVRLAGRLVPTLTQCQSLEEREVFPLLRQTSDTSAQMLDRLHAEHIEDEDHAAMLADAINGFAHDPAQNDAEALGFFLRGLFQPLRRHVAFDREVILPMYRHALNR